MANTDDLNDAVNAFRRTERALKEAVDQTRALRDASARLASTEQSLAPVAESVKDLTDSLEGLHEQFAALLPRLEKTTGAFLSVEPETLLAALADARQEVAGLAGSFDEWRRAFATALENSTEQSKKLTSTVGTSNEKIDALKTEFGVLSRILDERLERWNREQTSRSEELRTELGRIVEEARDEVSASVRSSTETLRERTEALQEAIDVLATGQARLRVIALVAAGLALVAAVAAILAAT